jgi:hypothetical protein
LYADRCRAACARLTRAPPQWLPLLEPLSHRRVPQVVLNRLNARQVSSFCGLFPEIGRVWCAIDNVLFIWRYDAECVPCACFPGLHALSAPPVPPPKASRAAPCALPHRSRAPLPRSDHAPLEHEEDESTIVNVTLITPPQGEALRATPLLLRRAFRAARLTRAPHLRTAGVFFGDTTHALVVATATEARPNPV